MKALLLISVLLSCVLAVTAQKSEVVEAAPQEVKGDDQVVENEVGEFVPEEPEMFSAVEMASSAEGRFFVCPTGWIRYKNSCYLYVATGRSWSSAEANCRGLGASLASVGDLFDYSFLQELTRRSGNTVAWMGGFYFQAWRWVDQRSFTYNYWSSQNTVSRYQCIHLNSRAGWSNNNCANSWPSICMKRSDTC
ncbi:ladderlectin-like [Trachinotus anak]|uniref:ladderlectin-like n=1 Tax=Trachinotus anak TaxID=443729 RepID=UPI0039F17152